MNMIAMTDSKVRINLQISGSVQGVGFRYFVKKHAQDLGLCGWVQNQPDGSVEAEFEGDPETVEQMIALCRQGPGSASVEELKKENIEVKDENAFRVKQ